MDCTFLAVTLANGEVKILKMPAILNPMDNTKANDVTTTAAAKDSKAPSTVVTKGQTPTSGLRAVSPKSNDKEIETVKNDIEKFAFQEINTADATITTIAAKKRRTYAVEKVEEGESRLGQQPQTVPNEPN